MHKLTWIGSKDNHFVTSRHMSNLFLIGFKGYLFIAGGSQVDYND
jgi:hypothetical protein